MSNIAFELHDHQINANNVLKHMNTSQKDVTRLKNYRRVVGQKTTKTYGVLERNPKMEKQ